MTSTRHQVAENGSLRGDEAFLAALLRGMPVKAAAKEAKFAERTAYRRVADPDFRRRLDEGRAQITSVVAAQLAGGAELGHATLIELAADKTVPAAVRRAAAADLIRLAGEIGAARDVEARLESLEDALREVGIKL
jgi:transposase